MDTGLERIKLLSRQARQTADGPRSNDDASWLSENRAHLTELERAIPARLKQLAEAVDGDLRVEDSAFRSQTSTALRLAWRPAARDSHEVELWLLRETGSVEWRWTMGHRLPQIVHRVPAAQFDLARLDDLVAALADPSRWRGGHPPEI